MNEHKQTNIQKSLKQYIGIKHWHIKSYGSNFTVDRIDAPLNKFIRTETSHLNKMLHHVFSMQNFKNCSMCLNQF